jgi:hypothetical protein
MDPIETLLIGCRGGYDDDVSHVAIVLSVYTINGGPVEEWMFYEQVSGKAAPSETMPKNIKYKPGQNLWRRLLVSEASAHLFLGS